MGEWLKPVLGIIGGLLLLAAVAWAFVFGAVTGIQEEIDSDIDEGIEKVLSRDVPRGVIDEKSGSYRGVSLGDRQSSVIRALGAPSRSGRYEYAVPDVLGGSVYAGDSRGCIGENTNVIAYRDVAITMQDHGVCSIYVGGGKWSTSGGISAGDSIESIKARFGDDACSEVTRDNPMYAQWECDARLDSGIRIHFGTDPVTGVEISR